MNIIKRDGSVVPFDRNKITLAIKKALQKLVESENPNEPYSDDRLCALLRQQGFQIARRTVAKYRDQLMIEPAVKRRKRNQR